MESGFRKDGNEIIGWAKVYRKDMSHPFCVEVNMKEYNRTQGTWLSHPTTMIVKVAEAQALRKAFQISGLYSPDEYSGEEKPPMREIDIIIDAEQHQGDILIHDPENGDVWIKDQKKKAKKDG